MDIEKIKQLKEAKILLDGKIIDEVEFNKLKSDLMTGVPVSPNKVQKNHKVRNVLISVFIGLIMLGGGFSVYIIRENHNHEIQNKSRQNHRNRTNKQNKKVNDKKSISSSSEKANDSETIDSSSKVTASTSDTYNGITEDEAYAKVDLATQGHGNNYQIVQRSNKFYKYVSIDNPNYIVTVALNSSDSSKLDVTVYGGASAGSDGYSETMTR